MKKKIKIKIGENNFGLDPEKIITRTLYQGKYGYYDYIVIDGCECFVNWDIHNHRWVILEEGNQIYKTKHYNETIQKAKDRTQERLKNGSSY